MSFWKKLKRDRLAMVCLGFIVCVILLGVFAPWIAPYDPLEPNLANKFASWSLSHLFGSDHLGRDIFSRVIYGIRTTLFLAFLAMGLTLVLGSILGMIAGYFRRAEGVILRFCDVMLSFPSELMMLAIVGMLGIGIKNIIIANIISKVAWYTRMVYSLSAGYKNKNYILFSKVCGHSSFCTLQKHIAPLLIADIVMLATLDAGAVILSISTLSFLGLGVQPPTPEWGMMLSEAKNVMSIAPMQMIPSGFMILLVVAAFNFLGDSIRDLRDPKYNFGKKSL